MVDTLRLIKVEYSILRDEAALKKDIRTYKRMQKKVEEAKQNLRFVQERLKLSGVTSI